MFHLIRLILSNEEETREVRKILSNFDDENLEVIGRGTVIRDVSGLVKSDRYKQDGERLKMLVERSVNVTQ
tara:strand:- start:7542 stop:7754 length:213 start_codon:yes stop_codon:yes gene_type:complete